LGAALFFNRVENDRAQTRFAATDASSSSPIPGRSADTGGAEAPPQGIPRRDPNSQKAHAQLLEKAKRGRIDVYFEGDSITRRWGATDPQYKELLANWNQNFFGWNAANFGWGGDTVQNVLWRLQNGELEGVHPRIVVLMAGTNNLEGRTPPLAADAIVEKVTGGMRAILATIREKAPGATILLMSITPRADRGGTAYADTIREINDRLSHLADGTLTRYLDLNQRLSDPAGQPLPGMTVDGLHLTLKAYQIWADALKPIFTELLGPPASTDHAPPPTGDPSVQQSSVAR
jgi:lysophospholipase L1-like esterase